MYNCAVSLHFPSGMCDFCPLCIHIYIFTCVDDMLIHPACVLLLCRGDSLFRVVHGLNAMPVSAIATATAAMEEKWRT